MLRQVRATTPTLHRLAARSKSASLSINAASTTFQKRAHVVEMDSVNSELVATTLKLGSSVLSSLEVLQKTKDLEELHDRKSRPKKNETENSPKVAGISLPKALGIGAGIAAIPALAANYTINRASDEFDAKFLAIPSLAAATVGAILAARSGKTTSPPNAEDVAELESAINAKEVLDTAQSGTEDEALVDELAKMSSLNTDHIASLVTELLGH